MQNNPIKHSVILPIYNEELNISALYQRITSVMTTISESYEIIFVNDGSKDNSLEMLIDLHKKDQNVKVLSFSRNFGHQIAVTAGLKHSGGVDLAVLDADLQDPPEILPSFYEKIRSGFDVVYAIRKKRKEILIKRMAYFAFYRVLSLVADVKIPLDSGDFCVMSRKVVDNMNSLPERNRFIRGLRSWVGYKQIGLEYERNSRYAGASKYSIGKLLGLASDGIFSFSYMPLKLMLNLGFMLLLASFVTTLLVIYLYFFSNIFVPGFATTVILITFFGGLQMLSIGVIGEYIGRIYDEVKQRPHYIIDSKFGF